MQTGWLTGWGFDFLRVIKGGCYYCYEFSRFSIHCLILPCLPSSRLVEVSEEQMFLEMEMEGRGEGLGLGLGFKGR